MAFAAVASGPLTFPQHLVLWLHVAFVAFTIGPVTLAILSTPRYIRQRDARIVRYLSRITFIFMLASLGVLIAGIFLAQMLSEASKWWVIVSATLFVVAVALLVLIIRDQRHALKALTALTAVPAGGPGGDLAEDPPAAGPGAPDAAGPSPDSAEQAGTEHVAATERARIAMMGGLVATIWLVILVLMVWNS